MDDPDLLSPGQAMEKYESSVGSSTVRDKSVDGEEPAHMAMPSDEEGKAATQDEDMSPSVKAAHLRWHIIEGAVAMIYAVHNDSYGWHHWPKGLCGMVLADSKTGRVTCSFEDNKDVIKEEYLKKGWEESNVKPDYLLAQDVPDEEKIEGQISTEYRILDQKMDAEAALRFFAAAGLSSLVILADYYGVTTLVPATKAKDEKKTLFKPATEVDMDSAKSNNATLRATVQVLKEHLETVQEEVVYLRASKDTADTLERATSRASGNMNIAGEGHCSNTLRGIRIRAMTSPTGTIDRLLQDGVVQTFDTTQNGPSESAGPAEKLIPSPSLKSTATYAEGTKEARRSGRDDLPTTKTIANSRSRETRLERHSRLYWKGKRAVHPIWGTSAPKRVCTGSSTPVSRNWDMDSSDGSHMTAAQREESAKGNKPSRAPSVDSWYQCPEPGSSLPQAPLPPIRQPRQPLRFRRAIPGFAPSSPSFSSTSPRHIPIPPIRQAHQPPENMQSSTGFSPTSPLFSPASPIDTITSPMYSVATPGSPKHTGSSSSHNYSPAVPAFPQLSSVCQPAPCERSPPAQTRSATPLWATDNGTPPRKSGTAVGEGDDTGWGGACTPRESWALGGVWWSIGDH